jgi:hypothetical protein
MKVFLSLFIFFLILPIAHGNLKREGFLIQIGDRSFSVVSPQKREDIFSVVIENKSLSDQIGKFILNNKTIKHLAIRSGSSETVEIENKSKENVSFIPLSPAFQEIPLDFGKKAYEIPANR